MATYSGSDKRLQYLFQHGGGGSLEDLDDVEITNPSDGDALVYDGEEEKWVNGEGGGGNANEQVLTKAEYDALTEEQKMNNTTYYINDADTWTSKEVQPVIYSTEEREIGVWIDGKPLYQKTIRQSFTSTGKVNIGTDIDYVQTIATTYLASGIYDTPFYLLGNVRVYCFVERGNDNSITLNNEYNGSIEWIVTIQYTKTTDQAGSGIYTPQGQLAVHYSTDEHVIGTWIDGKPLYEKVFTGLSVALNGISWVNLVNIQDAEFCLSVKAYRTQNPSYAKIPIAECDVSNGNVRVSTVSSTFNMTINMAIVQYTKTTS